MECRTYVGNNERLFPRSQLLRQYSARYFYAQSFLKLTGQHSQEISRCTVDCRRLRYAYVNSISILSDLRTEEQSLTSPSLPIVSKFAKPPKLMNDVTSMLKSHLLSEFLPSLLLLLPFLRVLRDLRKTTMTKITNFYTLRSNN